MIILQPAYGRDYKSVKAVKEDIAANKDFILNDFGNRYDGLPCSPLQDFKGQSVQVRFAKNTKQTIIKL